MNFGSIFQAALKKAEAFDKKHSTTKASDKLISIITENKNLAIQFNIYNTLKNKTELPFDQAKGLINLSEQYSSKYKFNEFVKANKFLAEQFNLDTTKIQSSKLDNAIDFMLRLNSGGPLNLNEGYKYREVILNHLTTNPIKQAIKEEFNNAKKAYEKLSLKEQHIIDIVAQNNISSVNSKIKILEKAGYLIGGKHMSSKDDQLLASAVTHLKVQKEAFDIKTRKTVELFESVKKMLKENEENLTLGDSKTLKKIKAEALTNKDGSKAIFLSFSFNLYPYSKNFKTIKDELLEILKEIKSVRTITHKILRSKLSSTFESEVITDSTIRTTGISVGATAPGSVTITLYPREVKPLKEYKNELLVLIKELENIFYNSTNIPQLDKNESKKIGATIKPKAIVGNDENDFED